MRQEKNIFLVLLFVITVLAFLAGFGFEKFLKARLKTLILKKRRSIKDENRVDGIVSQKSRLNFNHQPSLNKRNFESRDQTWSDVENEYLLFHNDAMKEVKKERFDEVFKYLTEEPHIAGSERNNKLGSFIAEQWKSYNEYIKVYEKKYDVLLSLPTDPAVVNLYNNHGELEYEAKTTEEAFYKEENSSASVFPFNAYSKSGDVKAEFVNVHYGDVLDYMDLKQSNVDLKGKIFVARYGSMFRGEKARLAEENGAVGLLLYPDPEDYGDPGSPGYPESWDLPRKAIPRGTITNVKGDPLTPHLPSTEGIFRLDEEKVDHLTNIPVQPISYNDAEYLLRSMDGVLAPERWAGSLNVSYRINTTKLIHMKISTPRVKKTITNVMGVIRGDIEPDRFVVIGNHRDSWVFGAGDASSGTTCMMEVSRVLGLLLGKDWRPRRTIIMMSWDAEEYGLVGSMEWLQEYFTVMQGKTIAYLNVDICVSGPHTFRAKATPSLADSLFEVTKLIENPDNEMDNLTTVFDVWKERKPNNNNDKEPYYSPVKSGSDFQGFYTLFGIPCTDIRWEYSKVDHPSLSNYPVYHTIYDNYQYYKKFIDPDMRYHTTVTKVWLRHLLKLSDEIILPFNLTRYAEKISDDFDVFNASYYNVLKDNNISLGLLFKEIDNLVTATKSFQQRVKEVYKQDLYGVRRINDQMMWFERAFIIPYGLSGRVDMKHAIFSPARKSMFKRNTFPGLTETLYEIEIEDKTNRWDEFKTQLSILLSCLRNSIQVISKDDL